MRLDKLLSGSGFGSRKEVKGLMKMGLVSVNGEAVYRPETKVEPEKNVIMVGDTRVEYEQYTYLMLNKPADTISATEDEEYNTVIDLLEGSKYEWFSLFPVGRLDKDTTGLLLLSNDGGFAHRVLSPKKMIPKVYIADVIGELTDKDIKAFKDGIVLEDGYRCLPAALKILEETKAEVTIYEGKYHQVKRMMRMLGKEVVELKRIQMAGIELDESLSEGHYRPLNEKELLIIDNLLSKD